MFVLLSFFIFFLRVLPFPALQCFLATGAENDGSLPSFLQPLELLSFCPFPPRMRIVLSSSLARASFFFTQYFIYNAPKNVEHSKRSSLRRGESTDEKIEKGDAGFITVFSLPYDFENIVYRLKPRQISVPYHSKNGWYIFKDLNERPAVGKITVAQILFAVPQGDDSQKEKTKKLADSVYNALQNGSDFSTLAKQFSDDRTTFMNGGLIPEFGTAKYDSVFEDHAFALKEDGEISKPFETKFGYHILKRISARPVPSTKSDASFLYNLKLQVLNDNRIQTAKEKFVEEILPKIGYKKNNVNQHDFRNVVGPHPLGAAGDAHA